VSEGGSPAGGHGAGGVSRERLLALAVDVAREAGALLLERFERGSEPALASKSTPTDLVSEADLASERLIRERLAAARPDDAFLGEEGGGKDGSSGLTWVVDPLDGTVNFLFGVPQWCVSIAVRAERPEQGERSEPGEPSGGGAPGGSGEPSVPGEPSGPGKTSGSGGPDELAGVVFDPCRDELFCATREGPALLADQGSRGSLIGGKPLRAPVDRCEDLSRALVATGFAYDARVRAKQAEVMARLLPRVRDIRRFGSAALDLAWTAAGRYDAYFERTVKPWDIAAGMLVCERAGLKVRELPAGPGLPGGVLAAPGSLVPELLALVG
jgi:myo-inositol-1(or 4)-monophosphatase